MAQQDILLMKGPVEIKRAMEWNTKLGKPNFQTGPPGKVSLSQ